MTNTIIYTVCVDDECTAWRINGELHRENGPALEFATGKRAWYKQDKLHRKDGPAIENPDGSKLWYINGERMTEEEHSRRTQPVIELTIADIEKIVGYRVKIVK